MRAAITRALVGIGFATGVAALGPTSVQAQIQQLPETSRSEAQTNSLNSQIETQQQNRSFQQQNQFETNQIRGQIQSTPAPIVVTPPPIAGPRR
jgi:predicted nuclease of restriction endonuclease-like (RecB) superfamily